MKGYFADVRRAGFDIGVSAGKLARAMVEVLLQLPPEATPSKEVVVRHLGLLGQIAKTRDVNAAWNRATRQSRTRATRPVRSPWQCSALGNIPRASVPRKTSPRPGTLSRPSLPPRKA